MSKRKKRKPDEVTGAIVSSPKGYEPGPPVYSAEGCYYPTWKPIFTNCNVCGITLRTQDEDEMGMCERCAAEES